MKKYIYFIISIILFTQVAVAKTDCDKHIEDYFNKNYHYKGGASAAAEIAIQRRCLHERNPIYSDINEYKEKLEYLYGIDEGFLVRKNLIDYQETAEVLAKKEDIEKSLEYIDKFNEILIEHYDKVLVAQILKDQVESGLISKAHQKELFEKLDKYLFKIGKCNPGICEGWGIISTVAGAFPKCAENSCQKNITYENLYFDLTKTTNNFSKATETIKKLLAKDFGTSQSNGEVKAPLMLALYYTDLDAFFVQAKNFLDKAQKTIKYDYQDAILLPLITQLMLINGQAKDLLPYTKTEHKNVAGLEAALALLSVNIGASVRQNLRADLETYYELTSACEEYRYEEYQGEKILRAGTLAALTQDTELDLFLRQRIQNAYWTDNYGNVMDNVATSHWCIPSLNQDVDIYPFFASAQVAKNFVKECLIDDIVLLPLFAFNKIKTVIKGVKQTPKLRISYINGEAVEKARNAHRVEQELETNIQKLWEMPEELPYKMAAGQDFTPGYNIGDRGVREFTNGKSWRGGDPKTKTANKKIKYSKARYYEREELLEEDFFYPSKSKKNSGGSKKLKKDKELFNKIPSMRAIGYEKANKLAEELGLKNGWRDLERYIQDRYLTELLGRANEERTREIFDRIKTLWNQYRDRIASEAGQKFTFAYFKQYDTAGFDIANVRLVDEVVDKNEYLKNVFQYGVKNKPEFLSDTWFLSPKNSQQALDMYTGLLGCTPVSPCKSLITDNGTVLILWNSDKSRMIRVSHHEYTIDPNSPGLHIHYYETNKTPVLNHQIMLDSKDPKNPLTHNISRTIFQNDLTYIEKVAIDRRNLKFRDLLLPIQEILASPLIR